MSLQLMGLSNFIANNQQFQPVPFQESGPPTPQYGDIIIANYFTDPTSNTVGASANLIASHTDANGIYGLVWAPVLAGGNNGGLVYNTKTLGSPGFGSFCYYVRGAASYGPVVNGNTVSAFGTNNTLTVASITTSFANSWVIASLMEWGASTFAIGLPSGYTNIGQNNNSSAGGEREAYEAMGAAGSSSTSISQVIGGSNSWFAAGFELMDIGQSAAWLGPLLYDNQQGQVRDSYISGTTWKLAADVGTGTGSDFFPTSTQPNDIIIAWFVWASSSAQTVTLSIANGWQILAQQSDSHLTTVLLWYRATGSGAASVPQPTISFQNAPSNVTDAWASVILFRGSQGPHPTVQQNSSSGSTTVSCSALTTHVKNSLAVAILLSTVTGNACPCPAGKVSWDSSSTNAGHAVIQIADERIAAANSTSNSVSVSLQSSAAWHAYQIEVMGSGPFLSNVTNQKTISLTQ